MSSLLHNASSLNDVQQSLGKWLKFKLECSSRILTKDPLKT